MCCEGFVVKILDFCTLQCILKANIKPQLRLWMAHHAPQTPPGCVSKGSALRLAVMEKLVQPRSLISVESVAVITKAVRRCPDSSQSLCE